MAAKKKAAKAGAGAVAAGQAVRTNQYIHRLVEDEDLRDNLRTAFESARKAYGRMSNGKGPVRSLTEDKKVLDALFGAEEEFEYTATTTPEPASSEPVGTT